MIPRPGAEAITSDVIARIPAPPAFRLGPTGFLFDVPALNLQLRRNGGLLDERRLLVADPAPGSVEVGNVHRVYRWLAGTA